MRPGIPPSIFNVPASCLPSPKLTPRPAKVEDQQLMYFLQKDITSFDAFKPERNLQKQYKNLIISRSKDRLLRDFLMLPCKRKLQYITSSIDKDQVLRETFDKVQTLQQKNVFLQIQIRPTVSISGGLLSGMAENNRDCKATSILIRLLRCDPPADNRSRMFQQGIGGPHGHLFGRCLVRNKLLSTKQYSSSQMKTKLTMIFTILLALLIQARVEGLQVLGVVGGRAAVNGSSPLVVLDCHYIIPMGEESGLVVKWYHGHNPRPVYQWIYGSPPQALGILRGRLDLRYKSSPDLLKAHSALAFVTPTTELAGTYTCRVATYEAEDSATGEFIVYTPASEFDLKMSKPKQDGKIIIACEGRNVFPEPSIALYRTDTTTQNRIPMHATQQKDYDVQTNLYHLAVEAPVFDSLLFGETEFQCVLSIPGTSYRLEETLLYYPDAMQRPATAEAVSGRSLQNRTERTSPSILTLVSMTIFFNLLCSFR
ncbi:Immunoglobulin-like domain [Trinorchestia longiramus]|nr:Immunoglobulin-like domain [Trinorchestia longiramus]